MAEHGAGVGVYYAVISFAGRSGGNEWRCADVGVVIFEGKGNSAAGGNRLPRLPDAEGFCEFPGAYEVVGVFVFMACCEEAGACEENEERFHKLPFWG